MTLSWVSADWLDCWNTPERAVYPFVGVFFVRSAVGRKQSYAPKSNCIYRTRTFVFALVCVCVSCCARPPTHRCGVVVWCTVEVTPR